MGVNPSIDDGGGARTKILVPPSRFTVYLATVYTLGFASIAFVLIATDWPATFEVLLVGPTIFLAVAAVVGEVKPIRLLRAGAEERTLSTSAPFVLALVAVAGPGIAILVQAIASGADDILNRRPLKKSLFNTSQYAVSVLSAGAVYSLLADVPLLGPPRPVETSDLIPLLLAGVTMFAVNWLLVAIVVSLATGNSVWLVLRGDLRDFLVTNLVLLSVGGIAALEAADGVGALLLLAAPVVAAHLFASAAARHAHAATHDSLTGLGNRGQLQYELAQALVSAQYGKSAGPGLVLLDLDHFKDINDTLGHPVGDQILRKVADHLVAAAPEESSVHRLGGDEFAVVVRGDADYVHQVAQELLASLYTPISIDSLELLVRVSAGVAVAPMHGSDGETLMKNADIALYHAKLERDRISLYSPEFDINTVERLQLLADLRTALDTRQLEVVYQPQVDLNTRKTEGVEALVRWNHPERGRVRPEEFIPLAENSGLIFPLTAFAVDTALEQLSQWRAGGHDIRVAVNLSARQLSDLALPTQVAAAGARHGVPLSCLVLEVTETGILSDPNRASVVIRSLRQLGVSIAIDDYGTGNASLSYLKRLEIDELKIDKSFVSNIGTDSNDLIIVQSTIALALALGLRVVAEGIEDEDTAQGLSDLGKVIGQGYHLGRPAPAAQIGARLNDERTATAAGSVTSD